MGRAFEYRKARKMKRWGAMSSAFTRIGKEIAMAVKAGGPDPVSNTRLRVAIANAKGVSMPKDKVESAIKRAASKDEKDYEEVVYEGYGPHGVAVFVETATDNPVRTVANIRMYFNRNGGSMGTSGSLEFVFDRKGVFKFDATQVTLDDIELELIDLGAEDIVVEDDEIIVYTSFEDFATMQKGLEERDLHPISAELQRIAKFTKEIDDDAALQVEKLLDAIEEDEDVQAVYNNMA